DDVIHRSAVGSITSINNNRITSRSVPSAQAWPRSLSNLDSAGDFMILTLLFAGMVFAAATMFGAAEAQPVRISYGGTSGYNVPVWVTQDAGLFKTYGLNAELIFISGAAPGMQAMLANEVHFANTSGSAPINATLQGTDAVIIATSYDLIPYGFVVNKDIHTPADL